MANLISNGSKGNGGTCTRVKQGVNSKYWKNIAFAILLSGFSHSGYAQSFDTSGDSTVTGPYFVRQVLTQNDPSTSAIDRAVSLTGIMTFSGTGTYSFTGQITDTQANSNAAAYSVTGSYGVSASGLLYLTNPIDTTDTIYGGVGAIGPSALVGSSTEGPSEDIFIAVPAGSNLSNSSVQGTYNGGFIDFLQANAAQVRDGYFTLTSSGSGSFGTVSITGAMANQSSSSSTQSFAGVSYSITGNGSGTLTFPTASAPLTSLVSGQKTLYVSADGSLLIGGNPDGFDLVVAVKGNTGTISDGTFQGTYFNAAVENFVSNGQSSIDSFYGAVLGDGQGNGILYQRFATYSSAPYDFTGFVPEDFHAGANYNDGTYQDMLSASGQALLQVGTGPFYSLVLNLQAKAKTGSGVFINPLGVLNAASYAPITNSVAPGEFITIFGSGLATGIFTPSSLPLPTNLGGVSVTVNGQLAPLSYVSPGQINILVPIETTQNLAAFQVTNNNAQSNTVTLYTAPTAPGVFTGAPSGIGVAAILHSNYTPVTQASPALAGETVLLYLTGLGSVTPVVADGAAAPSSTLSTVDDPNLEVDLFDQDGNDQVANIAFAGLAPGFAGLYQINFTIPSGLTGGQVSVDVGTSDAYTTEAITYVGGGASANSKPRAAAKHATKRKSAKSDPAANRRKVQ
jgi:uncharacterized protein (TIGR03437 family)